MIEFWELYLIPASIVICSERGRKVVSLKTHPRCKADFGCQRNTGRYRDFQKTHPSGPGTQAYLREELEL